MPKTLLLADDSRTIQQAVSMTFAGEDVKLITASDGEAALQAAKQSKPDLILADVVMPKLGGYELCQRVRADAALKDVPVLLLGGPVPIDPAKAMTVGANGHMPKPFDSAKLIEHVKTILANPKAKPIIAPAAGAAMRPGAAPARPSAPPPAASRPPPASPPIDDDEEIPLDEEVVEEVASPAPTPLRPVPSSTHKPSLSVVPPPADGGEAMLREALSKASREVIEKIAWEVVPELAETIIREELERLIKERGS